MTVFDLALRSMRQNIKHYYLYFFALIFSISLFYVFSSLKYDQQVQQAMDSSINFQTSFQIAAVLLIVIIIIFTVSSNRIFLQRRSREIGLYQLIGLSKGWVARYLVIENVLLGLGALVAGIICGALVSRLFVLILMKLLEIKGLPTIDFSLAAALETIVISVLVVVITSVQMMFLIFRSSLLNLFQADKQPDLNNRPSTIFTAIVGLIGLGLIGFGYELSGRMVNENLASNAFLVLASTITGTYLFFRVTIRWCLSWIRKRKNGHLGLYNSLSIASLMHRMKNNANSLTLITLLSALTITLVSTAYSLYYTIEQSTRLSYPYDFAFEDTELNAETFKADLGQAGISYNYHAINAIRTTGIVLVPFDESRRREGEYLLVPAEQLQRTGADVPIPAAGEVIQYDANAYNKYDDIDFSKRYPTVIEFFSDGQTTSYALTEIIVKNLVNNFISGEQLLVTETTLNEIVDKMSGTPGFERVQINTYQIPDKEQLELASSLYGKYLSEDDYSNDYYAVYRSGIETAGLLIFIAAFLGLAFLASTGSILYFKQMTEAEQEKQGFRTLRQLGFDEKMIMKGIRRKQLLVFLIPLGIGILHSIFAVKAASFMIVTDYTVPALISIGAYAALYILFAIFTMGYYKKIVRNAML